MRWLRKRRCAVICRRRWNGSGSGLSPVRGHERNIASSLRPVRDRTRWSILLRFAVPAGACDTHAHVIGHVIGSADRFPMVANRSYTPPPASEAAYLGMLDSLGMARGVLVQISVYGTDNRCMIESLKAHPDRLRGVAVVAPDVGDAELEALHAAGVRGIRINVLFGGGVAIDEMERLAARVAPLGWHIQLLIDARNLPELGPRMMKLPVEVVIDHMGHMPVSSGVDASRLPVDAAAAEGRQGMGKAVGGLPDLAGRVAVPRHA